MFQDFYCWFLVCLLNVGPKRLTIRWAVLTELGSMFFLRPVRELVRLVSTIQRNRFLPNQFEGEFSSIVASPRVCHLINWFARASISGGIVTPICFAVLRLITSSNFFGCSTGRSAALAPFRILST